MVSLTRPYEGVPQLLDRLTKAGHLLGICTNKPVSPARAILNHLGLLDHFAVLVGGDSLSQRKPDPAPLHLAIKRATEIAGAGAEILYIGDSEIDAQPAAAAKVNFGLFTGGYRKTPVEDLPHHFAFDSFAQVQIPLVPAAQFPSDAGILRGTARAALRAAPSFSRAGRL